MAPLTSPPGCVSCTRLADRITELEQRISSLHQIREAELQMDTIIFGPAQSESPSATCPVTDAASPLAFDVTAPGPAAAVPSPNTNPDDTWIQQGAKPKFLPSSTPCEPASWTPVAPRRKRCPPPHAEHHNIQLENRYNILNVHDFPLLAGEAPTSPPSAQQSKNKNKPPTRIPPSSKP
ncbi:hypothetical protein ABVT39_002793 [Epinephelus coioides]